MGTCKTCERNACRQHLLEDFLTDARSPDRKPDICTECDAQETRRYTNQVLLGRALPAIVAKELQNRENSSVEIYEKYPERRKRDRRRQKKVRGWALGSRTSTGYVGRSEREVQSVDQYYLLESGLISAVGEHGPDGPALYLARRGFGVSDGMDWISELMNLAARHGIDRAELRRRGGVVDH